MSSAIISRLQEAKVQEDVFYLDPIPNLERLASIVTWVVNDPSILARIEQFVRAYTHYGLYEGVMESHRDFAEQIARLACQRPREKKPTILGSGSIELQRIFPCDLKGFQDEVLRDVHDTQFGSELLRDSFGKNFAQQFGPLYRSWSQEIACLALLKRLDIPRYYAGEENGMFRRYYFDVETTTTYPAGSIFLHAPIPYAYRGDPLYIW